jgi:hypothetical protein
MDQTDDQTPLLGTETEMKELLGLYDVPAFARRGHDLEYALDRLDARFRRERVPMLDMVRLRLKQCAAVAADHNSFADVFTDSIEHLWPLTGASEPIWTGRSAPVRKLRTAARELVASVERFNRRWTRLVEATNIEPINHMIERYNRYYVLEKECSLGSARLASRYFKPRPKVSHASLLETYPLLPVPGLRF